jgi:thiol-disulfide isomerase/thioredoxin
MTGSATVLNRLVFVTALLLAAGAGGFLAHRLVGSRASSLTAAPAAAQRPARTLASQSSPQPEAAPPSRSIPEWLPEISLSDGDGVRHKLSDWKGRPLLVNFWATWCAPCRKEIPLLKSLRRERSAEALEVIGVAVDFRDAVLKYAHDIGIDYPVLLGEQEALDAVGTFGMDTVLPFTVFADGAGRIVTLKVGELHRDEANLILDRMDDLRAGRLDLPNAREQIATGIGRLAGARAARGGVPESSGAKAADPGKSHQEVP